MTDLTYAIEVLSAYEKKALKEKTFYEGMEECMISDAPERADSCREAIKILEAKQGEKTT